MRQQTDFKETQLDSQQLKAINFSQKSSFVDV